MMNIILRKKISIEILNYYLMQEYQQLYIIKIKQKFCYLK